MRILILALGVACIAGLYGQNGDYNRGNYDHKKTFSWQDACFEHPGAPYCQGHDFALKPAPGEKKARAASKNPMYASPAVRTAAPSTTVVGAIDWRFADPSADALVGVNFSRLAASPLVRTVMTQLGAKQGLSEADMQQVFERLSTVDQVALSMHGDRVAVMLTGAVTESAGAAPAAGLKIAPVSADALLMGRPDVVDQAMQRINYKFPPSETTQLAEALHEGSDFWVIGSPKLAGPQAQAAGVTRFSAMFTIQDRIMSDVAFEFFGTPNTSTVHAWPTTMGSNSVEGSVLHSRMSLAPDEAAQKIAELVNSPLGDRLGALLVAAKNLPAREAAAAPKHTRPVIYGLDEGPRELR